MKRCKQIKQSSGSSSRIMSGIRMITAVCVVFAMLPNIEAHDQVPGAPQSRPIVIRNATVHVVDGADINDGDVLFEAGKITRVGKDVKAPRHFFIRSP